MSPDPGTAPLLKVEDLAVAFPRDGRLVNVVDGVSFSIQRGETLALVGESGCGKSITGLSLLGLAPPPGRTVRGTIQLEGENLHTAVDWERVRGRRIAMVFQDPLTSLDPVYTAGEQIAEGLRHHFKIGKREAWRRAVQALDEVGIAEPANRAHSYPHQLSGGMRQRVMIAAAIATEPALLIADEPTTALDVTVQAQVLDLLIQIQRNRGMAMLLITHDLGVVAKAAQRVSVLYAGQIVEAGEVSTVLARPRHPYTAGLLAAVPRLKGTPGRLTTIEGTVPAPGSYPAGCRFRSRCPRAGSGCDQPQPLRPGRSDVRCLYPLDGADIP